MHYKLLNKIEDTIKACCVELDDYELLDAASLVAYKVEDCLDGVEVSDKDWTLICANIQAGFAMASAKAIRILAAGNGVITND